MIPIRLRHVLPALVLAAAAAPACAQEVQPRNPAERRALEVARLVDRGVAVVLSNYGAGSFPVVTKLREIATAGR